jgi:2-oxoglutarate dehydrogenase E2 component (dihydrolipoamide succinyltransferase)
MAQIEILLPKMGESVAEATIIKWNVEEGATIEADDAIVEIATDKVDSEVPAPEDGVLVKKLCNDGDVVQVGQAIAILEIAGEGSAPAPAATENATTAAPASAPVTATATSTETAPIEKRSESGRFYSPLVRSIAAEEGISMTELDTITGTGQEGRVTKNNLLDYLANGRQKTATAPAASTAPKPTVAAAAPSSPSVSVGGADEIVQMDRMRKLIADHMVNSVKVAPHVTSFVEADVTNLVLWREKNKKKFLDKEGEKLTFTPIFIEAVAKAIRDFPNINCSVDGDNIILKKNINIGMAAALPSGNLIVPVIKNADQLNLVGLAKAVNSLADRARKNQLKPDEIQGGTYTLTNVGSFGNVMGTPIINQPQVAIMAVGDIRKKPAVIETPQGDTIGIRHMMFLSHSYDHRVVDGALGGMFVKRVAKYLEEFDINREI